MYSTFLAGKSPKIPCKYTVQSTVCMHRMYGHSPVKTPYVHRIYVCRVGQNRIYAPYTTVYLVISLPKTPYIHRTYMVLANPTNLKCSMWFSPKVRSVWSLNGLCCSWHKVQLLTHALALLRAHTTLTWHRFWGSCTARQACSSPSQTGMCKWEVGWWSSSTRLPEWQG